MEAAMSRQPDDVSEEDILNRIQLAKAIKKALLEAVEAYQNDYLELSDALGKRRAANLKKRVQAIVTPDSAENIAGTNDADKVTTMTGIRDELMALARAITHYSEPLSERLTHLIERKFTENGVPGNIACGKSEADCIKLAKELIECKPFQIPALDTEDQRRTEQHQLTALKDNLLAAVKRYLKAHNTNEDIGAERARNFKAAIELLPITSSYYDDHNNGGLLVGHYVTIVRGLYRPIFLLCHHKPTSTVLRDTILAEISMNEDQVKKLPAEYSSFFGDFDHAPGKAADRLFTHDGVVGVARVGVASHTQTLCDLVKDAARDYLIEKATFFRSHQAIQATATDGADKVQHDAWGQARAQNVLVALNASVSHDKLIEIMCAIVFKSGSSTFAEKILEKTKLTKEQLKYWQQYHQIPEPRVAQTAEKLNQLLPDEQWPKFKEAILKAVNGYRASGLGGFDGIFRAEHLIKLLNKIPDTGPYNHEQRYFLIANINAIVFQTTSTILKQAVLDNLSDIGISADILKDLKKQYAVSDARVENIAAGYEKSLAVDFNWFQQQLPVFLENLKRQYAALSQYATPDEQAKSIKNIAAGYEKSLADNLNWLQQQLSKACAFCIAITDNAEKRAQAEQVLKMVHQIIHSESFTIAEGAGEEMRDRTATVAIATDEALTITAGADEERRESLPAATIARSASPAISTEQENREFQQLIASIEQKNPKFKQLFDFTRYVMLYGNTQLQNEIMACTSIKKEDWEIIPPPPGTDDALHDRAKAIFHSTVAPIETPRENEISIVREQTPSTRAQPPCPITDWAAFQANLLKAAEYYAHHQDEKIATVGPGQTRLANFKKALAEIQGITNPEDRKRKLTLLACAIVFSKSDHFKQKILIQTGFSEHQMRDAINHFFINAPDAAKSACDIILARLEIKDEPKREDNPALAEGTDERAAATPSERKSTLFFPIISSAWNNKELLKSAVTKYNTEQHVNSACWRADNFSTAINQAGITDQALALLICAVGLYSGETRLQTEIFNSTGLNVTACAELQIQFQLSTEKCKKKAVELEKDPHPASTNRNILFYPHQMAPMAIPTITMETHKDIIIGIANSVVIDVGATSADNTIAQNILIDLQKTPSINEKQFAILICAVADSKPENKNTLGGRIFSVLGFSNAEALTTYQKNADKNNPIQPLQVNKKKKALSTPTSTAAVELTEIKPKT